MYYRQTLVLLLAAASTALARGILVLPGGTKSTVTPLTALSPVSDKFTPTARQEASSAAAAAAAAAPPLRIMSLGASVTFGTGSTTGNSYRKALRDKLVAAGQTVSFVGEFAHGDFANAQVEATPGFVISQIANASAAAVPRFLPNLVLLDAGTNNCNRGGLVPDAGANVSAMIGAIYAASPGATVVLASILANKNADQDACRVDINTNQYAPMVASLQAAGARLVFVDMRGPEAPTTADLADTRHPNDAGYDKMATVWLGGIQEAMSKGFITAPAENGIPADGGA